MEDATCGFSVTITDNQAPTFSGCTNITTNAAPGVCTATATYTPTATDNCDGSRPVTCIPASGSTFNKGVTTVTCSASDLNTPTANTSTCMFTVTVNDTQPPTVTCPASDGTFAASDCLPSSRSAYTGATLYSTGGNTVTNAVLFGMTNCTAPGNVVFVNASTGDFVFCSGGVQIASGRGTLTVRGCQFGIEASKGDARCTSEGTRAPTTVWGREMR